MKVPCVSCGKVNPGWCNKAACPLFPKMHIPSKQSFSGSTPNLFVGKYNYPNVNVGVLATEQYTKNDDPKTWTAEQTPISQIMQYRSALVNSTIKGNIREFPAKYTDMRELIAQATKPVAVDVDLAKPPTFTIQYPTGTTPHGPSVELKHAELTENVHVPTDVDKIVHDELLATQQVNMLSSKHDVYYIQKLFAAGLLGIDKKLVPTRWTITAVDDTLGKKHLEKIREFPVVNEPLAYTGGHYGNYYCILLLPAKWQYELFELYVGKQDMETKVWTDYESFKGRTSYADSTVGGYYAARVAITELLTNEKRQASVLAFRFVTDEYTNPLGVWVVREAVNIAMQSKPLRFSSNELALQYLKVFAKKRFNYDVDKDLRVSKLMRELQQKSLSHF
jgi:DNA repair protein NreA